MIFSFRPKRPVFGSYIVRRWARGALVGVSLSLLPAGLALAEAPTAEAPSWPKKFVDPHPLADDLVLPMPCGGAMAFRPVDVSLPSAALLDDREVTLGSPSPEDGYSDFTLQTWLSAPFPVPNDEKTRRYYLGKYDVTLNQYRAVMEGVKGNCPSEPSLAGQKPQTAVSWNDAQNFLTVWTSWLLKNAPAALPRHQNAPGFLRLPTDEEWSYAARGGAKVSSAQFLQPMWPLPDGAVKEDYIVAGAQDGLQKVGSKKPNPLGLYDMLGEVDQMLFEPYRLHRGERLQGQAGGIQLRGGNYLAASADEISTATRREAPAYNVHTGEPTRQVTTGFRVAIGADALDSPRAVTQAQTEFKALYDHFSQEAAKNSPASHSMLASMSARAADPAAKAELAQIKAQLAAEEQKREETQLLAVRAQLQALMALGGTIGELDHVANFIATHIDQLSQAAPQQDLTAARANLAKRRDQLRAQSEAYAALVRSMARQAPEPALLGKAVLAEEDALKRSDRTAALPLLALAVENVQRAEKNQFVTPEEIITQMRGAP